MIWMLLGLVIGVILAWYFDGYFSGFCIALGFTGFIIGAVCWLAIGGAIGCALPTEWECVESYEICAFKDNSAIEGEKFLFSGYIEENYEYRFIKNTSRGKIVESINTENFRVYLQETNEVAPKIERYTKTFINDNYWWFACPVENDYYIIYFPEGTMTNEYYLDLE